MLLSANVDLIKAEYVASLGYDAIDVGLCRVIYNNDPYPHNPLLDSDDYEKELDRYKEICERVGLKILTSHIPYRYKYDVPTSENYEYYYNMTCRALKASEYLGAEWAVVHMKSVADTVSYVKKLLKDSGVTRIGIALENMADRPIGDLIEAHDILEREGVRVGVCFDTGHANVKKFYDIDVAEAILKLGKRIKMLHVHDNNRASDMHKAPFMGTVPWKKVMTALKEAGYEGEFNFELQPEKVPHAASRELYEQYSVEIGKYLIELFDKA